MSEAGLFSAIYAAGGSAAQVSDAAWLQAMLDFEAALARSGEAAGQIPAGAGVVISEACRAKRFDLDALGAEAARHASPAVALVAALRQAVGPEYADHVHVGATSQDVIDTAAMLVSRRALGVILHDTASLTVAGADLARRHVDTPMIGRTLLQQALPVSFGLVAAQWVLGVHEAGARLGQIGRRGLPVQMGGPVGIGSPQLAESLAAELGLAPAVAPWHTVRVPPAALATALGVLAGVLGKVARDVTLLASQEVGEVRDGTAGSSSAMSHKRNPVAAISLLACSRRVPGLVSTMLQSMEQEHQRAAGAWQSEWGTLSDLLRLTGSAAAWGRRLLERLEVDPARMAANLEGAAASGIDGAGDPRAHLGSARELVTRILAEIGESPR